MPKPSPSPKSSTSRRDSRSLSLLREEMGRRQETTSGKAPAPSLLSFTARLLPGFQRSRHAILLCELLEEVNAGRLKRLIIEAPPRHGKSEIVSRRFPAWYLGQHPDQTIIHCSYGWQLVHDFAYQVQSCLLHPAWGRLFPGVALDQRAKAVEHWRIEGHQGYYHATGVGGAIVGYGANVLIVDDPIKMRADVESPTFRDKQWNWWISAARRRVEPEAAIIMTCTRWHTDDLIGRILAAAKESGESWTVVRLPAIAEEGDPLGRAPGEALWPDRWPLSELEKIRDDPATSPYEWNAQYQQRPVPPGGAIFRHDYWRTFDPSVPRRLTKLVQSWDTSFKKEAQHDYSACWTGGLGEDGRIYVLDVAKWKVTAAELIGTQQRPGLIARHYHLFAQAGLPPTEVAIEDTGSGMAALQLLAAAHPYLPLIPVPTRGIAKEERARAVVPFYDGLRVYHREDAPWRSWYEPLCELFPGAAYDDPVDAMSQGIIRLVLPPEVRVEVFSGPRVLLGRY